ncbi:caspase domain-containing protein [Larkinella bovis]|uniref:Caspase domain-containing protein n=1 Tax=Larkinella bovis TaxID=683041 RepID=A0ABW0I9A9_9BACT
MKPAFGLFLMGCWLGSWPLFGQSVVEPIVQFKSDSIPAMAFSVTGSGRHFNRFYPLDADQVKLRIGDTVLVKVTPIQSNRNLIISIRNCYGDCTIDEKASSGSKTNAYSVLSANVDTLRDLTLKVPITPTVSFTDPTGRKLTLDNSGLKFMFVYISNPNMALAQYDLQLSVIRRTAGNQEYPLPAKLKRPSMATARYHAVLIGINDYSDTRIKLNRPRSDIARLDSVLRQQYDFASIIRLPNATKKMVKDTLTALSYRLLSDDNLLIFFAGHSVSTDENNGFWALQDTRQEDLDSYLSNAALVSILNEMRTQHLLLVVDACYGATIVTYQVMTNQKLQTWEEKYNQKSRKAMSGSSLEEVPDNSVFLEYFIKKLATNDEEYLSSEELFDSIKNGVHNKTQIRQKPTYGHIKGATPGAGDFLFKRKPGLAIK